jgi:hypothetical protein
MSRYTGLSVGLSTLVRDRDRHRCRWCGRTDQRTDLHHIRYRRGAVDDVADNLVLLCRDHHDFVHGRANARGQTITKEIAQLVLRAVIARPGLTGMACWRQLKRAWASDDRCEHGTELNSCYRCVDLLLPNV